MIARNPFDDWNPKLGRFHSTWATRATTEWASKYGVLPKNLDPTQLFNPYGKSALTPYAQDNPGLQEERRNLQKWLMSGFWPEILHEFGAYPYDLENIPVLNNPIDPLFAIQRWQPEHTGETWRILCMKFAEHEKFLPIEEDNTMLWTANNPAVWRRLEPILKLCTRFLHHSTATTWLDAFLFGANTYVPEHLDQRHTWEEAKQGPLMYFHKRDSSAIHISQTQSKIEAVKELMAKKIQFGLGSELLQPWDRKTPIGTSGGWDGYTLTSTEKKVWIEIAHEMFLPLFRHDLSAIEKLSSQFYITSIILHEFAHALNQLQDLTRLDTIPIEPAYGGDEDGNGAETFCELGFSFLKGLLGANLKPLNPVRIVGTSLVGVLLNKEIPSHEYDKGIYLHESGEDVSQFEETNRVVPIVSKYFEKIHTDTFWDRMAINFGVSMLLPTPAPILVVEPDRARPDLSNYVFNESKRVWMSTAETVASNTELLLSLNPDQREALNVALRQKDEEFSKLRRMKYLNMRIDTVARVKECFEALEKYFRQGEGDLSGSKILGLLRNFAATLQLEADQEAQCSIDFMACLDPTAPSDVEFRDRLIDTNWQVRELVTRAKGDCTRVGVATLGLNFPVLQKAFDRILFALQAVNFILVEQLRPEAGESYEEVIARVGNAIDPYELQRLSVRDTSQLEIGNGVRNLAMVSHAMNAYWAQDYKTCHALGLQMLSQLDMEGYSQGIGMVLIAMHPGEIRRRWCSYQGLHVLNIMAQSNPSPLLEQWIEIAKQVHHSIEDMAINSGIGNEICILRID